jgi:hypothetical protein
VADDRGHLDFALQEAAGPDGDRRSPQFFAWSYAKGDKMADELDYVPMPDKVVGDIEKMWSAEIKDATGKSLFVARK